MEEFARRCIAAVRPVNEKDDTGDQRLDERHQEQPGAAHAVEVEALTAQAKALGWLTGRIEALEHQVAGLTQERDRWRTDSEQAKQAAQHKPQTDVLEAENRRLKAELATTNRELATANLKLDSFRKLLNGGEDSDGRDSTTGAGATAPPANTDPAPAATTATATKQPTPSIATEEPATTATADRDQATTRPRPGNQKDDKPAPPTTATPDSSTAPAPRYPGATTQKQSDTKVAGAMATRGRKSGGALARAERIFQAIQAWNIAPDRGTGHRWAITVGLLEEGFGIHRAVAKSFVADNQKVIDEHHQQAGIENPRSHNRGKDVQEI